MRWSIDTDPPVVLHAKPSLIKERKYRTRQIHHNGEDFIEKAPILEPSSSFPAYTSHYSSL